MQAVVIYDSHYGHTEQYARWLAEALGCRAVPRRQADGALAGCDTVIYGGGLYAGGVAGARFLTRRQDLLAGKRLALFTCGVADPRNDANAAALRAAAERALPPALRTQTAVFHLRGGIDYARLGPVHRAMMAALRAALLRRPEDQRSEEDRALLETYGQHADFLDRAALTPLLQWAQGTP